MAVRTSYVVSFPQAARANEQNLFLIVFNVLPGGSWNSTYPTLTSQRSGFSTILPPVSVNAKSVGKNKLYCRLFFASSFISVGPKLSVWSLSNMSVNDNAVAAKFWYALSEDNTKAAKRVQCGDILCPAFFDSIRCDRRDPQTPLQSSVTRLVDGFREEAAFC